MNLDLEFKKISELSEDQEKSLLLYNSTLPESGVQTKQLNAEIYQCKVGI